MHGVCQIFSASEWRYRECRTGPDRFTCRRHGERCGPGDQKFHSCPRHIRSGSGHHDEELAIGPAIHTVVCAHRVVEQCGELCDHHRSNRRSVRLDRFVDIRDAQTHHRPEAGSGKVQSDGVVEGAAIEQSGRLIVQICVTFPVVHQFELLAGIRALAFGILEQEAHHRVRERELQTQFDKETIPLKSHEPWHRREVVAHSRE